MSNTIIFVSVLHALIEFRVYPILRAFCYKASWSVISRTAEKLEKKLKGNRIRARKANPPEGHAPHGSQNAKPESLRRETPEDTHSLSRGVLQAAQAQATEIPDLYPYLLPTGKQSSDVREKGRCSGCREL